MQIERSSGSSVQTRMFFMAGAYSGFNTKASIPKINTKQTQANKANTANSTEQNNLNQTKQPQSKRQSSTRKANLKSKMATSNRDDVELSWSSWSQSSKGPSFATRQSLLKFGATLQNIIFVHVPKRCRGELYSSPQKGPMPRLVEHH